MAGGDLFNHESYYNGLTTDWSCPPLSRAHTRTRTRVLRFFAVTSVTDWYKLLKFSSVCLLFSLF